MKISDHYPVEVQFKTRMHPDLEESVRISRNAVLLEDNRLIPKNCRVTSEPRFWIPFAPILFYDDSSNLVVAELSARFPDAESACSGLKILREKSAIPYSLFSLATYQMSQFESNECEVMVKICLSFSEAKTTILLCQI
jgi:hypothetical protein